MVLNTSSSGYLLRVLQDSSVTSSSKRSLNPQYNSDANPMCSHSTLDLLLSLHSSYCTTIVYIFPPLDSRFFKDRGHILLVIFLFSLPSIQWELNIYLLSAYRNIPMLFDTNYNSLKFFFLVPTDLIFHMFLSIKKKLAILNY